MPITKINAASVPSTALLRVLRQLALAGTVTGIVLAEDRRRRICTMSQIKDNAKKLKKSPRYSTAGAAAVKSLQEYGILETDGSLRPSFRWTEEPLIDPPLLPSEIERGYSEKRRLTINRDPNVNYEHGHNRHSGHETGNHLSENYVDLSLGHREATYLPKADEAIKSDSSTKKAAPKVPSDLVTHTGLLKPAKAMEGHASSSSPIKNFHLNFKDSSSITSTTAPYKLKRARRSIRRSTERGQVVDIIRARSVLDTILDRESVASLDTKSLPIVEDLCRAARKLDMEDDCHYLFWRLFNATPQHIKGEPQRWLAKFTSALGSDLEGIHSDFRLKKNWPVNRFKQQVEFYTSRRQLATAEEVLIAGLRCHEVRHFNACVAELILSCWWISKDLGRVEHLLQKIYQVYRPYQFTYVVYDAMIQCCVEAKNRERLEFYLKQLRSLGVPMRLKTNLHLMLMDSFARDWVAVEKKLTLLPNSTKGMERFAVSKTFNRLLLEYGQDKGFRSALEFLERGMEVYGIRPNNTTNNVMMVIASKADDFDSLVKWLDRAQELRLKLNGSSFRTLIRWFQQSHEIGSRKLFDLLKTIANIDKDFTSEDPRKLRHLIRSIVTSDNRLRNDEKLPKDFITLALMKTKEFASDVDLESEALYTNMKGAILSGHPHEAVQRFQFAQRDGLKIKQNCFELALRASQLLWNTPYKGSGAGILATFPHEKNVSKVNIVNAGAMASTPPASNVRSEGPCRIDLVNSVAHQAIVMGNPSRAVSMFEGIAKRYQGDKSPLTIISMSIWVRAYASVPNIDGVEAVVREVLRRNLRIDEKFISTVARARTTFWHLRHNVPNPANAIDALMKFEEVVAGRRRQQLIEQEKSWDAVLEVVKWNSERRTVERLEALQKDKAQATALPQPVFASAQA